MKLKKIMFLMLALMLIFPTTFVSASDLNWPIEIEADDESIISEEEAVPINNTSNAEIEEESSLSPIDNTASAIEQDVIFKEENYNLVDRLTNKTESSSTLSQAEEIYSNYSDVIPVVTTDQMVEWILRKGNELISILQIFAQPFAIIIFIISCAICLIGSLTKGNMAGKGLMGMVASAILYAACLYAPTLVNSITGFLAS